MSPNEFLLRDVGTASMANLVEIKDVQIDVPRLAEASEDLLVGITQYEEWIRVVGNGPDSGALFMNVTTTQRQLSLALKDTGFHKSGSQAAYRISSRHSGLPATLYFLRDVRDAIDEMTNQPTRVVDGSAQFDHFRTGTDPIHFDPDTTLKLKHALEALKLILKRSHQKEQLKPLGTSGRRKPKEQNTEIPEWNSSLRKLTFRGKTVKQWNRPAKNQISIIEAFQKDSWPTTLTKPEIFRNNNKAFGDAIYGLNRSTKGKGIGFEKDGSGMGVTWTIVTQKDKPYQAKSHRRI